MDEIIKIEIRDKKDPKLSYVYAGTQGSRMIIATRIRKKNGLLLPISPSLIIERNEPKPPRFPKN